MGCGVKTILIEQAKVTFKGTQMRARGRRRAFDPNAAPRKALDVFWERG